jgi:hypothetical protein
MWVCYYEYYEVHFEDFQLNAVSKCKVGDQMGPEERTEVKVTEWSRVLLRRL